jgi:CheY-like chemotaxis protein
LESISGRPTILRNENNQRLRKTTRLHVLLVEDRPSTAKAMQRLLEENGFAVKTAGTYRDAIAVATTWLPDVLISDIDMPGKDGIELMNTMRQAYPDLKGIVVSGDATDGTAARCRDAGFIECLTKPIAIDQVLAAIARMFQ